MTCYHPVRCYSTTEKTKANKRKIVFSTSGLKTWTELQVPCGQCIGCRLEKSRQWAVRMHHESKQYDKNCFITLTYDDDNLPYDHSLNIDHFQKFMKRFRKELQPQKIRFYHAGEYGQPTPENDFIARPHYHAVIFNYDLPDKQIFKSYEGIDLHTSDYLDSIWGMGFTSVGDVTFESAAYVARYIMKKINGDQAHEHYTRTDHTTGDVIQIQPEYATMSRRPGIGADWFKKYKSDCYPSDSISVRGSIQSPPKYYDYLYELDNAYDLSIVKQARKQKMRKHIYDNTPERLLVREQVKIAQTSNLNRKL